MQALQTTPRLGLTGARLERLAEAVAVDTAAFAETMHTTRVAVVCAMSGVLAGMAAQIDREAAARFFNALSVRLMRGAAPNELDARRVDKTASALFEADLRAALTQGANP